MRFGAVLDSEWAGGWWLSALDGVLGHLTPESGRSRLNHSDADFNNVVCTLQNLKLTTLRSALGLDTMCGTFSRLLTQKLQLMAFRILHIQCRGLGIGCVNHE